jgi:hypothetical protein
MTRRPTPRKKELRNREARARRQKKKQNSIPDQEEVSTWKPEQDKTSAPEQDKAPTLEQDEARTAEPTPARDEVSTWKPKQDEVEAQPHSPPTNAPESQGLSAEDAALFEAARTAVATLKRTFEDFWLPIAEAVARALEIVDQRGTGKTDRERSKDWMRLLEQQGLGAISENKTARNKLLTIWEHKEEVEAWRAKLTPEQRIKWASPSSIHARCPDLKKLNPPHPPPPPPPSIDSIIGVTIDAMHNTFSKHLPKDDVDHRRVVLEQLVRDFSNEEIEEVLASRRRLKGNDTQVNEALDGGGQ